MARPVLITGASSGIGYELAKVCAAAGHDIIAVARREGLLHSLQRELEQAHGVKVWVYVADLTEAANRQALFDWVQAQPIALYALVNNAGFGYLQPFAETDWDTQNAMLQLNMVALTHLTRLFLPGLIAQGQGRIMNVASTAAFVPGPYMAVYYASKAYVQSFTEAIASELSGTGVTATVLCPGPTASEFQARANLDHIKLLTSGLATSAEVAAYGYRVMEAGKRTAIYGWTNRLLAVASRLQSSENLANVIKKLQKPS